MSDIIDNLSIALIMKVNELAARYRLDPTDFAAEIKMEMRPRPEMGGVIDCTGNTILEYAGSPTQASKRERFEQMLESLGIPNETGKMIATDSEIWQALNKALELAPRARGRG
jgi:hypothetical protein